jgi:hypothetical protein
MDTAADCQGRPQFKRKQDVKLAFTLPPDSTTGTAFLTLLRYRHVDFRYLHRARGIKVEHGSICIFTCRGVTQFSTVFWPLKGKASRGHKGISWWITAGGGKRQYMLIGLLKNELNQNTAVVSRKKLPACGRSIAGQGK